MRPFHLAFMVLLLSSVGFSAVMAQDAPVCGTLIEDALDLTNANCGGLARNQICYGNVELIAEPQEGVSNFNFDEPGDVVPVATIRNLTLNSTLREVEAWGIALMQLQANLPDTLPGQNVTFLLFGNVEIENAVGEGAEATPEAESGDAAPLTTMQAFYFASSVGDLICNEAPESGILIQTPQGASQIELVANEVNITLGSTAYLQAQPSGEMTISLLEGQGEISAFNVTVTVPAGYRTRVPLDANGIASGAPSEPEPLDPTAVANLPIRILPRAITIAAPEATAEPPSGGGGMPLAGQYEWINGTPTEAGCPAGSAAMVMNMRFTPAGPFRLTGESFDLYVLVSAAFGPVPMPPSAVMSNPEPNTSQVEFTDSGAVGRYYVTVIDESSMEGELSFSSQGCTMVIPFTVVRIGD